MMHHDDADDCEDDEEGHSQEEGEWDGPESASADTSPCPYCGQPVYEDAEVCPHCRSYISAEDETRHRRPWWVVVAGAATVVALVLRWVFRKH